jgi:hypothetical protein
MEYAALLERQAAGFICASRTRSMRCTSRNLSSTGRFPSSVSNAAANRGGPVIGLTIAQAVIIERVGAGTAARRASNHENALAFLECRGHDSRGAALHARRRCWLEWHWHHAWLPDFQAGARLVSQPPTPRPLEPLPVMPASYMKPRLCVYGSSPTHAAKRATSPACLYPRPNDRQSGTELREVASRFGSEIVKLYKDHGISRTKDRDSSAPPSMRSSETPHSAGSTW